METPYTSKSGLYTGILVTFGKNLQCILDKKSKRQLAIANLKLIRMSR
jgi:hypothetical protein